MFVTEEIDVHVGLSAAQARLMNLVSRGSLSSASRDAYDGGLEHLARVGPLGEVPGVSKLVKISFVDPVYRQEAMTLGLRWEATGVTGGLFPVFDGDLTLSRIDAGSTRLTLVGSYRPPLGGLGAGLNKAVMGRVAQATIRALLRDVETALADPDATAHSPPATATGEHPRLIAEPETPGSCRW
jgi:hypothetical protein